MRISTHLCFIVHCFLCMGLILLLHGEGPLSLWARIGVFLAIALGFVLEWYMLKREFSLHKKKKSWAAPLFWMCFFSVPAGLMTVAFHLEENIYFFVALISLLIVSVAANYAIPADRQKQQEPDFVLYLGKSGEKDTVINKQKTAPRSSYQITPLLNAVLSGDLKLVQATLAEHPEQLNIAYAPNGNTPLHVAALNGHTGIMEFLLTQPAIEKDRKNNDGKTAFDLAAKPGGTSAGK